ncbi:MAG: tetratricopeptide repeat protein [Eubacterium sp.]|nr:tetratricopeptide repeat protein [Eubacterium sp.]
MDMEKRALLLSNRFYNRGLDKAQIRDLSGAVEMLRQSLQFNKKNIMARNLLGLVYFEMGEAVAALSEWVISKNLQPQDNIASQYIDRLQSNQAKLSIINQTIKSYNIALENCRQGDEDIAAISLKKVIAQNSHFIKAYHLLALIYIKMERYTRARKLLRKAVKIDATNATTLRFLKEIDEQTGIAARQESRRERGTKPAEEGDAVQTAVPFRERRPILGLVNILLGIAIGVLAVWFIAVPSIRQAASREANEQMVEYNNTVASKEDQITQLQGEVDESNDSAVSARKEVDDAKKTAEAAEKLLTAYVAYQEGRYTDAADAIAGIDASLLSRESRNLYDTVYNETKEIAVERYKTDGMNAFDYEQWGEAIENLEKALALDDENYTVLDYLALSYRANGDTQKAIETFQRIVDLFPDTRRATSAAYYIEELGGTVQTAQSAGTAAADGTAADGETAQGDDAGDAEDGSAETADDGTDSEFQEENGGDAAGEDNWDESQEEETWDDDQEDNNWDESQEDDNWDEENEQE